METQEKAVTEIDMVDHHRASRWLTVLVVLAVPYIVVGVLWMDHTAADVDLLTFGGLFTWLAQIALWPLGMLFS